MSGTNNEDQAVFEVARKIESREARQAYLQQICGQDAALEQRITALLHAYEENTGFLESPPPELGDFGALDPVVSEASGTQIGPYKLLQQIGEGGMGVVFVAEQTEPVQRMVALKVIKPGMDSRQIIARFAAERQALAMMNHANIARVLDAGATESGRPYFVMELIHGVPITQYCDDNQLTPRQRLELFVPVCQAIQHAHQKGIIHRDVKPTNVMVTLDDGQPVPKVIDFGVAKAIEQNLAEGTLFTHTGTLLGTLEYMSPEQAEMSVAGVDTRSDIYSLGVLLYELLTGSTPLDRERFREAAHGEILRMIREDEPAKPSNRLSDSGRRLASISARRQTEPEKLSKLMRGELDWIVMKTLEKDRNRRYETASGLVADVQHYLNDEPVQACPPSAVYRFHKFARRNRMAIVTAALVSAALVLGTVASTWQAVIARQARGEAEVARSEEAAQRTIADQRRVEADEQRQQAEEARKEATANLQKAREAVDQMLTRTASKLHETPQMTAVRKALLEDALKFYQGFLQQNSADPALRLDTGRVWSRIGTMYKGFDLSVESEKAFRESIMLLERLIDDFPSEPSYRSALADSCMRLGEELSSTYGRHQEALPVVLRAVTLLEELATEHPEIPEYRASLAQARRILAHPLICLGRSREAAEEYRRGLVLIGKLVDQFPTSPSYLKLQARILGALGREIASTDPPEAEKLYRQSLAIRLKALAENPNSYENRFHAAWDLERLGNLLRNSGQLLEAEEAYRQAIEHCRVGLAKFSHGLNNRAAMCNYYVTLGELLEATNRRDEAEQFYRLGWTVATDKLRPDAQPPYVWFLRLDTSQVRLVKLLMGAGRNAEAEAHYRQALAFWEKLAEQSPAMLKYRHKLAATQQLLVDFLLADGRPAEAEKAAQQVLAWLDEARALQSAELGPEHPDTLKSMYVLAKAYARVGRLTEAIALYEESLKIDPNSRDVLNSLAWLLATSADTSHRDAPRAVVLAKKAVELAPDGGDWNTLGVAQYRAGDWNQAIASLEKSIELAGKISFNSFFLATAHWQLGEKDKARQWYDQAIDWMDKNAPEDKELVRFRAEAAALLGIAARDDLEEHRGKPAVGNRDL